MDKLDLWKFYTSKNPSFDSAEDTVIKMTAKGLKKMFDLTWDKAYETGLVNGATSIKSSTVLEKSHA